MKHIHGAPVKMGSYMRLKTRKADSIDMQTICVIVELVLGVAKETLVYFVVHFVFDFFEQGKNHFTFCSVRQK